ncbi:MULTISPECIES: hypothetical protein [unclassified Streptomyces]|uniref:hypothetical protein n=1 Tax=unclassified Streptomyces TaxID=2593676 RepID=UPI00131F1192|nr:MULTISPECIES: hypothetical protein [unclassified Streptomyces]
MPRRFVGEGETRHGSPRVAAQRYCQTRFLCDKYGLPLPTALTTDGDDDPLADVM